jgi:GNAT superfamily N-acetyltransferase
MLKLRKANREDAPLILSFIQELAEYERAPNPVACTPADLRRDGFGSDPKFRVIIAEWNGEPAGMALFFYHYSTWQGRPGIYIEDLFVRPQFRGKGIGRALMAYLARTAIGEQCYGLRWEVLDWNKPAIDVYQRLGSKFRDGWRTMQITGSELEQLAEASSADRPGKLGHGLRLGR